MFCGVVGPWLRQLLGVTTHRMAGTLFMYMTCCKATKGTQNLLEAPCVGYTCIFVASALLLLAQHAPYTRTGKAL